MSIEKKHDDLRLKVMQVAAHLDAVADLEDNVARFGLPEHQTTKGRAEANAKFLRGEAEILKRAAEELDEPSTSPAVPRRRRIVDVKPTACGVCGADPRTNACDEEACEPKS